MPECRNNRISYRALLISLMVVFVVALERPAGGGDQPAGAAPANGPAAKPPRGRLPPHYAGVVTEGQRLKIYAIQQEYRPRIEAMQARLDALKRDRDRRISVLLTDEQRRKIVQAGGKVVPPTKEAAEAQPKEEEDEASDEPTRPSDASPEKSTSAPATNAAGK